VTAEVTKGTPEELFVVDAANLQRLKDKTEYQHFKEFEATEPRTYQRSTRLNQGTYYLVLRDRTLGILSSPSSDVKVMARLET